MEAPHPQFWFEAHSDMTPILKKHVVNAYCKLHRHGVVHGAVEMCNIWVSGDGRVTLMDFSRSLSTKPLPQIGLQKAEKHHFRDELKEVMYKLDYEGARNRENASTYRMLEVADRNGMNEHLRQQQASGRGDGPKLPDLTLPFEDLEGPTPFAPSFLEYSCRSFAKSPKHYILPGQTRAQREVAVQNFEHTVIRLENEYAALAQSKILVEVPQTRLPIPAALPDLHSLRSSPVQSTLKRKAEEDVSHEPPPKRIREESLRPTSTSTAPVLCKFTCQWRSFVLYRPLDISLRVDNTAAYNVSTSLPRATCPPPEVSVQESSKASTAESGEHPETPYIPRDYVSVPYDGPRGYYFPHPPTEALASTLRAAHIRNENAAR